MKENLSIFESLKIVTTCSNYSDYLQETLPYNKEIWKDITVFTNPNDKETIDICKKNNVDILYYDNLGDDGRLYAKDAGACYNIFMEMYPNTWILFIDSDIMLPKNIKKIINVTDRNVLYYTSRIYIPMNYDIIHENINKAKMCDNYDSFGWTHLPASMFGYFMLFYNDNSKKWLHNDCVFADLFHTRIPLPAECAVLHIPHGTWDDWGKNFYGRKTTKLK